MENLLNLAKIAFGEYGVRELSGVEFNSPDVLKYFNDIGQTWVKTDELAWCAAYVNWCLKAGGYVQSGKLNARSLLTVGKRLLEPHFMSIVVLWRISKDSVYGHTGFWIKETAEHIYMLGGNQNNQVCIRPYPKYRLLAHIEPQQLF